MVFLGLFPLRIERDVLENRSSRATGAVPGAPAPSSDAISSFKLRTRFSAVSGSFSLRRRSSK